MTNWLITGAGGGLGAAIARAALDRGDRVCGTLRGADACEAFAALAPGRATGLLLDLSDSDAIGPAVASAERALGGIDRLVNNAGRGLVGGIEETSVAQARALFEVNVFGAMAMTQAVLPAMRARRAGHIVNITSVSGLAPWAGTGIYGATKYALECLGGALAQELAPFGIHVTNVAPGGLRTAFAAGSLARADTPLDDYRGTPAHEAEHILTTASGSESGDPVLAARAILAATDAERPPLHLLLGADALHYAEDAMAALSGDIASWRETTLSIAIIE